MSTHIYFDLDGTLTDPYEGITKCILYALDELGFPHPSDEYLHSCIGPPLYDTFPDMVGEDLTLKAIDLYRDRFVDVGWKENEPYEGILDALEAICHAGHTLFVATSKPHEQAKRIVDHFSIGEFIEDVYGCELDGTRSNKVELLEYAIAENPSAEARTMVGDRKHDLIGAVANNMRPIGVSYCYGSVEELTVAGAAGIASTPLGLPAIILN
ncbi:MAG: HAD hydrolase-like protein [Gammaproteobacteria bacterium]|nr:HAD hydrolase-like protein [Gammaproteobacteria bacterium]